MSVAETFIVPLLGKSEGTLVPISDPAPYKKLVYAFSNAFVFTIFTVKNKGEGIKRIPPTLIFLF